MGESKEYMTHPEELGCIHISEDVLASIAVGAAAEVEGVGGMMNLGSKKAIARGVKVAVEEDGAVIDLYVMIRYGHAIPEVAERMQSAVSTAVFTKVERPGLVRARACSAKNTRAVDRASRHTARA